MYLKRLEIKGFKSFADNTEIWLQPGVNIIVGPNGCGKSNIIDAIRWGLGESNVRNLRGHRGEDIIFNGTDDKRAQGMAHVEMLIDNEDRVLPFDYSEINIARKLFRSGESEFFVNKSRVRLKDVNNLFTGTGLGKKGYSIVGQGELEQVLNGQPLDRRLILEEASGIIKHRQQRDEVRRRIANSTLDLTRLQDILGELRLRKEELKVKADKAAAYIQLYDECQLLEESILLFELQKLQKDLERKNEQVQSRRTEMAALEQEMQNQEELIRLQESELEKIMENSSRGKEEKYQAEALLSTLQGEIRLSEERVNNHNERIKAAQADETKYLEMLENLNRDLASKSEDYEQQKESYQSLNENYQLLSQELALLEASLRDKEKHFEQQKAQVFEQMQEESELKNQLTANENSQRKFREKKERLDIHLGELKERIRRQRELFAGLEEDKALCRIEIEEINTQLADLQEKQAAWEQQLRSNQEKYQDMRVEEEKIDKQLRVIDNMEKNMEGYSRGVRAILDSAQKRKLHGFMGLVGEMIDIPAGLETAIEVVLGRNVENIVVEKSDHAREAIEYLKKGKLGRVTFLPLDILLVAPVPAHIQADVKRMEGVLGFASELIQYEQRCKKAVDYLLGRTLVVQDMETGVKVFKNTSFPLRLVTLEGELINVSGAMTGGSRDMRRDTPLQRKREKRSLLQTKEKISKEIQDNRDEDARMNHQMMELTSALAEIKNKLMERQFKFEIIEKQAVTTRTEIDQDGQERESILEQLQSQEESSQSLLDEADRLQQKLTELQNSSEHQSSRLEAIKAEIEDGRRDFEVHKERLSSMQEQLSSKKRELETIHKNMTQFNQVRDSYQEAREEALNLHQRLTGLIEAEKDKIAETRLGIDEQEKRLDEIGARITATLQEEKAHRTRIESLRRELTPSRQAREQIENSLRNAELSIARMETELEGLSRKWHAEFGKNSGISKELDLNSTQVRDYRQRVETLHQQIDTIGPVDIDSIPEYEAVAERYDFMNQQYEDLLEAKESLTRLLQETEKIMARDFAEFVTLADQSFTRTFKDIFEGGEASLRIETGRDKFEAGIDIEVKLPGKKSQSLNLLSGGERALTCIAFIFALLRLKPAPFCVLDEIDASLDETNLLRFSRFMKKMARGMQYIVITHRQSTIEAGDNIYGVTMAEKGISKVLTLNIGDADSMAG